MKSLIQKILLIFFASIMAFSFFAKAEEGYQDPTIKDIELLKDSYSYQKKLELVKKAKKRVWISVMVFDCSVSSKELYNELIRKQNEENVDVRILAEAFYTSTLSNYCYNWLKDRDIKISSVGDHLKKGGSLTRMMHEKFFLVDEDLIIMGGQNFIKYSNESNHNNIFIRDTDIYLKSIRLAKSVEAEFVWMWNFFSKIDRIKPHTPIEIINNYPEYPNQYSCNILIQNKRRLLDQADHYLTAQLQNAQSLVMNSPGVAWDKTGLFDLLKERIQQGLQYTLIRPGPSKDSDEMTMFFNDKIALAKTEEKILGIGLGFLGKFIGQKMTNSSFNKGLKSVLENTQGGNVTVYDYYKYSHTKSYLIDDKSAMFGSTNFDKYSFENNYEIALGCNDKRFINAIKQMVVEDKEKSKKVYDYQKQIIDYDTFIGPKE